MGAQMRFHPSGPLKRNRNNLGELVVRLYALSVHEDGKETRCTERGAENRN